jgi:hypothetical protein
VRKSIRYIVVAKDISVREDRLARKKLVEDHIQYVTRAQLRSLYTTLAPGEILTVLVQENGLATTNSCTT